MKGFLYFFIVFSSMLYYVIYIFNLRIFSLIFEAEETCSYVKCHNLSDINLFLIVCYIYNCASELFAQGTQSPMLSVFLQLQFYSQHGQYGTD